MRAQETVDITHPTLHDSKKETQQGQEPRLTSERVVSYHGPVPHMENGKEPRLHGTAFDFSLIGVTHPYFQMQPPKSRTLPTNIIPTCTAPGLLGEDQHLRQQEHREEVFLLTLMGTRPLQSRKYQGRPQSSQREFKKPFWRNAFS